MTEAHRNLVSLTVVAPFCNEEATARAFYAELDKQTKDLEAECELVFVDDGSADGTLGILNELAATDRRIVVLSLARNFGHQIALTAGLDYASGEAVITMDSDLQHPPDLIPALVAEYEKGSEVVYAVREDSRGLGIGKRLTARIHYWLLERFSDVRMIPDAADFRLMSRDCVLRIRQMREAHRYLRGMVAWLGLPHSVVPYKQPERYAGRPKYTLSKSLRLARHGLFSFSTAPLALVTWLGAFLALLGGIYLVYILVVTIQGATVPGWSSVVGTVLVIGGVQLLSLGILAQYIGLLFEQVKQRPLYVLKQGPPARPVENTE